MIQTLYFFKALHVVGFVAWFAGMFYLVRMFVYHEEAHDKPAPEDDILKRQFNLMEWRVYRIICNPAMMITWAAGLVMLGLGLFTKVVPNYLSADMGTPGWMHFKLLLLVLLTLYHLWCKRIIKRLEAGERPFSSWQYRLLNEFPTLFLILISFTAVYGKMGSLNYFYLFGGLILFIGLLYWGARAYRRSRKFTRLNDSEDGLARTSGSEDGSEVGIRNSEFGSGPASAEAKSGENSEDGERKTK